MKEELMKALGSMQESMEKTIKKINSFAERRKVSKHQAGKKSYLHAPIIAVSKRKQDLIPTNHERVVAGRAKKLGMTSAEYKNQILGGLL